MPTGHRTIVWTNNGLWPIGPWKQNCHGIWIKIQIISHRKMNLKMSSAKWQPFCFGHNLIIYTSYLTLQASYDVSMECYQTSNVRHTKSQNLNVSHLIFVHLVKPGVKLTTSVCETTSAHQLLPMLVILWPMLRQNFMYKNVLNTSQNAVFGRFLWI